MVRHSGNATPISDAIFGRLSRCSASSVNYRRGSRAFGGIRRQLGPALAKSNGMRNSDWSRSIPSRTGIQSRFGNTFASTMCPITRCMSATIPASVARTARARCYREKAPGRDAGRNCRRPNAACMSSNRWPIQRKPIREEGALLLLTF